MAASDFLISLLTGTPPRNIRLAAAQGLAPLPASEMIRALVHLTSDPDPEIATRAAKTLESFQDEDLVPEVQSRDCSSEVIQYISSRSQSPAVLEAIILNPSAPTKVIEGLALRVTGSLPEAIMYNRVRLLECPAILENLKRNPTVTPEVRRMIQEVEIEFFGEKKREYSVGEVVDAAPEIAAGTDLQLEDPLEDLSLEGLPEDPQEREAALSERISRMSVRQKIKHALLGNREARAILVRDPNHQVAMSVLQSPKLSESEVETFSAMRNVSDEILREIGNNRSWARSYTVVQNLVRNPKTPPMISQRLMFRLMSKDLMNLTRDRSIPEAVRRNAQRTFSQRTEKKSTG